MSQPTSDNLLDQPFEKLFDLAVMLGFPEEELEVIAFDIPGSGDEFDKNFAEIADTIIANKLDEMGYDGDGSYDRVYKKFK